MKFCTILLFVFPLFCFSQNVRVNVYDKFIKKQRIELEPVTIPLPGHGKLNISFTSIASTLYVQLSGSGWGASTIDEGNDLVFLFSNDSTVTAKSTGLQSFEPGKLQSTYSHQYLITKNGVEALSHFDLIGLRKYSFKDFTDISIPRINIPKIQKLSSLFLDELKKGNVSKSVSLINLKDIAGHVGDSVQFCTKIYNARYFETSINKPTVLDLQTDFADPLVNVVILDADRKNFNNVPEKLYIDKEVCISGLVALRNNTPYILLHDKAQIKLRSPISPDEVAYFIGDTVTVNGKVFESKNLADSKTLPTLLNIGAPFPDQLLTVVIENNDRIFFPENPEVFYLNKEISVSGEVVLSNNKPQIVAHQQDQITVLKGGDLVAASSTTIAPVSRPYIDKPKTDNLIETAAEFPGGPKALNDFLNNNLKNPQKLQPNEQRTVVVKFQVNVDGSISNIEIIQSGGMLFDNEAVRVINRMPKWKPKLKNGFNLVTAIEQPIIFKGIAVKG
ncbi:MAG: energy transducer TonB [Bacteroidota bacterium]|nr:energy transducer TonB [Bacteroidota bacterium]